MKTITLILTLLIISCSNPTAPIVDTSDYSSDYSTPIEKSTPSHFPSLNGQYKHESYTNWENGLYEIREYCIMTFDATDEMSYYSRDWSYTPLNGWINALKDSYSFVFKFNVANNYLCFYSTYDGDLAWKYSFEYLADGNFMYNGDLYIKQ